MMKNAFQKIMVAGSIAGLSAIALAGPAQAAFETKTYVYGDQQSCLVAQRDFTTGSFTRIAKACHPVAYGNYELHIAVRTA